MNPLTAPLDLVWVPLEGSDAEGRITLASFGLATAAWAELVRQITVEQSGARPLVRWVVENTDGVETAPVLLPRKVEETAVAEKVARDVPNIVSDALGRIERGEDVHTVLSPEAGEHARALAKVLQDSVGRLVVRTPEREVVLTREGTGRLEERASGARSIGSVEGTVNGVSRSEARPYFGVARSTGGRSVKCYFEESRHMDTVLGLFRDHARVLVAGRVSRSADGSPFSVTDIREIRRLGNSNTLPRIADILGIEPDLTEGMPSEEWLRMRRA